MSESNRQRMELRKKVLDFLEGHDIPYELHTHPPLFTIEEGLKYWKNLDCTHCKNLFFRNHKGNRHYLVSMECHKLEQMIHEGKLSFASEERMVRCLGLHPGSVSAFGLINDIYIPSANPKELFPNGHRVKYYLDKDLLQAEKLSFHPCENTSSVVVHRDGLLRFLEIWGGEVEWIEIV